LGWEEFLRFDSDDLYSQKKKAVLIAKAKQLYEENRDDIEDALQNGSPRTKSINRLVKGIAKGELT
jgi:hypothetical protein